MLEFARLGDASESGFTISGSGSAGVTTAPWFLPSTSYLVTIDGQSAPVTSDAEGRLLIAIDLGPARLLQQYRLPADGAYLDTATVTIEPV